MRLRAQNPSILFCNFEYELGATAHIIMMEAPLPKLVLEPYTTTLQDFMVLGI